jgi:hypothetical protein
MLGLTEILTNETLFINQQYKRVIQKAASLLDNDREQIRSQRPKQYLEQGGMLETIGIQSASTT